MHACTDIDAHIYTYIDSVYVYIYISIGIIPCDVDQKHQWSPTNQFQHLSSTCPQRRAAPPCPPKMCVTPAS